MTKITATKPFSLKASKTETRKIEFAYDTSDYVNYTVTAEVEISGEGENRCYTCTWHDAEGQDGGELSDRLWRCVAQKAEEIVSDREERVRTNRYGCECVITGDGELAQALHDDTCPIRLSKDERQVMREQEAKEARSAYRSSYDEARDLERAEMTEAYLNLK